MKIDDVYLQQREKAVHAINQLVNLRVIDGKVTIVGYDDDTKVTTVNVDGSVYWNRVDWSVNKLQSFFKLVRFGTVSNNYVCPTGITKLAGFVPDVVTHQLIVSVESTRDYCAVVDISNMSTQVGGRFALSGSKIETLHVLDGCGGSFASIEFDHCSNLKSLDGLSKYAMYGNVLDLTGCDSLTDLSGAANMTFAEVVITNPNTDLTTPWPKSQMYFFSFTDEYSFKGIHKLQRVWEPSNIWFTGPSIILPSNMLGLLMVRSLKKVKVSGVNSQLGDILTKHLRGDRDINECQEELIEAGFKAQAKL